MRHQLAVLAVPLVVVAGLVLTLSISDARKPTPTPRYRPDAKLSDRDLLDFVAAPLSGGERERLAFSHVVIGVYHGHAVVADYPCSDICPAETRRITHFDLPPGPECARAGGIVAKRPYPMGIMVGEQEYCVPAPLAGMGEAEGG